MKNLPTVSGFSICLHQISPADTTHVTSVISIWSSTNVTVFDGTETLSAKGILLVVPF